MDATAQVSQAAALPAHPPEVIRAIDAAARALQMNSTASRATAPVIGGAARTVSVDAVGQVTIN